MKSNHQHTTGCPTRQGKSPGRATSGIGASTHFDFKAQSLTPYGGLLPVAALLEQIGFPALVAGFVKTNRQTRAMTVYQFVLAIVLCMYVGLSRFAQFRHMGSDPILAGILKTKALPPQSTFWRFLATLHSSVAGRLVVLQNQVRARVWKAADVRLGRVTVDTDTTVHTIYGKQMGGRVSYAPKKKQARSYQPILTFLAETREYVAGELRNGDRPSAAQIQRHLGQVFDCLPPGSREIRARADSGFYCWSAVNAYESRNCRFIMVARKTARLVSALNAATWQPSRHPTAEAECDFLYQPEGWPRAYRFIALRFAKTERSAEGRAEQYQLFETARYTYRVFVTNMDGRVDRLVEFYNRRCAAENLIKEANNDAGMAAHPFHRFYMNSIHFQFAMLAYNLNCWLALFQRPENAPIATLQHTTLATSRLRFLFVAARLWRHAGRVGVSYSDQYPEKWALTDLMARLRRIASPGLLAATG